MMTEQTQTHSSLSSQTNEMPEHKFIPMEELDFIVPNQIRILYYKNPSQFYVYLPQKIDSLTRFQNDLQKAMQNYQLKSSSTQYLRTQPIVAQDNHAVWHRAIILDIDHEKNDVYVYFVDAGQQESMSINNIRPLPQEFIRQPAFAIPCRLYGIYPLSGDENSTWTLNDRVHKEFNSLMAKNANCKVCDVKRKICYDVEIDIPTVGDLGEYLFKKNFVSRITMRTSQSTNYAANQQQQQQAVFDRVPPGFSAIPSSARQQIPLSASQNEFYKSSTKTIQQQLSDGLQKPTNQQAPSTSASNDCSSDIKSFPLQDGHYIITHVYSSIEFYGYSQGRERELDAFYKHLENIYNNNSTNDQSLNVDLFIEGIACVIQQGDKYFRVVIKHRESESRVLVKLVDRGDEIIVDTSELLQLEQKYFNIPAFAQPFRLYNYDESHSTANITRKLKRLILNQRVHITQHLPTINGFYPVEVRLSNDQLVNEILLSNDTNPVVISPPKRVPETQTVKIQQDVNAQRINDDLPAPAKLLTAAVVPSGRTQPGRFTTKSPVVNEPTMTTRFSRSEEQEELRLFSQQSQPFQINTDNNFQQPRNRSSSREYAQNDQRKDFVNNNRRDGFGDRGDRTGFNERHFENNNENMSKRTGSFHNRSDGYNDRNFSGEGFQFHQNRNRQDDDNENNVQRFAHRGGFGGERGNRGSSFNNFRDRENYGGRGGRGGPRGVGRGGFSDRGGFNDRGGRGSFGDRGGSRGGRGSYGDRGNYNRDERTGGKFSDQNGNNFQFNSDNNQPATTFSGWPHPKPVVKPFEAAENFIENEIPREEFLFAVSHIENSNDFFIQLYSKEKELTTLNAKLQEIYSHAPELNFINVNQACLAKSSDDCWYRAIILSTGIGNTKVRFIDFGDTLNVDRKSLRQLDKQFSLLHPFAYRCILENCQANENIEMEKLIKSCSESRFHGQILKKLSNNQFYLESNDLRKSMININAIKPIENINMKCNIVHIDFDKYEFYIQDDSKTMKKIDNEIVETNDILLDDIEINSMIISIYNDKPCRGIIKTILDENDVSVYFIDYGSTNVCSKTSLKICNEQLKSYPYQAKRCQLYDVSSNNLDEIFKYLRNSSSKSDNIEFSIVNQKDDLCYIRLYIDGEYINEKSNQKSMSIEEQEINSDNNDQSSTTTTTTVKEQERTTSLTGKRNSEEILSPITNSLSASINIKRQKSESDADSLVNATKYHRAILTYVEQNKPIVYLQLLPESEANLGRINDIIDNAVEENKQNFSTDIGELVIAQFSDDLNHYRARIESYSAETKTYTVYFLDYGNIDEKVPENRLLIYPEDLKQIKPQAYKYSLEKLTDQIWINNNIRSLIENQINDEIEFYFIDEINKTIHIKFDNDNQIYIQPQTFIANISAVNTDCFYVHILPDADALVCEMDELLRTHTKEHHTTNSWSINDLCIAHDSEFNQYFRSKILSINNDKYDIQYIDYGNIISNVSADNLYLLNDNLLKRSPLAKQCRLYGVTKKNQIKAMQEVIANINTNECVTITVQNDSNDSFMDVMLFRGNHIIVNDQYRFEDNDDQHDINNDRQRPMIRVSSDPAITTDDDAPNSDNQKHYQNSISHIGTPQAESTHEFGDLANVTESNPSLSSTTMNQSIDFGENDPSTTTMKDDTESEN